MRATRRDLRRPNTVYMCHERPAAAAAAADINPHHCFYVHGVMDLSQELRSRNYGPLKFFTFYIS